MPKVTFISHDGRKSTVDAAPGVSVMRAAIDNGVRGIVADCGGALACATCHVYVDPTCEGMLPPPSAEEEAMLESAVDHRSNSRLCCQLVVGAGTDGIVIGIPEHQY